MVLCVHFNWGALLEVSTHVWEISELRSVRSRVAEKQTRPPNSDQINRSYKTYMITVLSKIWGSLLKTNNDLYALGKEAIQCIAR